MTEWETFCDECYYHMWRVRRKNERHFDDGFHLNNREEAQALVELLNGLERERDEAREQLRLANIDCYAALTELDAARELADRVAGERDESSAQLAAERALADRLGQSLLRLSGMSPLIYAHAMDDLAAWKEARNDNHRH